VSDITGSEMKEKSRHLPHQWRHWCFASCEHDRGLFTSKLRREIVSMSSTSPHQFELGWPRSDLSAKRPTVPPENGGNLSLFSPHYSYRL